MLTYSLASRALQRPNIDQVPSRNFNPRRREHSAISHRFDSDLRTRTIADGGQAEWLGCKAQRGSNHLEINPADVVIRRGAEWQGMRVEVIQCVTHDKIEFRFRAPWHLLLVYEEGVRDSGETTIGDRVRSTLRTIRRKLTFVPAGHEYREWQQPSVRARVICFYLDPAAMPVRLDNNASATALSPRLFFENNMVLETAVRLAAAIEDGAEVRYSEALGVVVAHELLRSHAEQKSPARGGLAVWQQRILANYVEEHLAEPVPLAALAKLVNLSSYYFCRAFKKSFGVPPHRYHKLRRIERAKILLANPDRSITETALTLGFSETSAFSAAFRDATGTTPTTYRRSI